ncbi:glycoside hydrolase domain-containing protein [Nocardioides antri]|nr:glycoside hydrolase domain-containing protein [Nocardioides antri]
MHLDRRVTLPPAVLAVLPLVLFLLAVTVVGQWPTDAPSDAGAANRGAVTGRDDVQRRKQVAAVPPAPRGSAWTGHAFDACRAPSQRVMDRWRTASPFTGVGIYLGGIHRACEQRHLTPRWVTRQLRAGWKLLPIWVGPQASCTGFDHRIVSRPGPLDRYGAARADGARQARWAAATARSLRLPRGELIFYDLEGFDTRNERCRRSSLAFLEAWTEQIHRSGYRSGVYSHVNSGIALLSRTGSAYTRPDAVWYAWIDRVGGMPGEYVADPAFMRASRVHQYALDTSVEFGGIEMSIDWNFVSLGATSRPSRPTSCEALAGRVPPRQVRAGERGPVVRAVQCLTSAGVVHPAKVSGQYDAATVRAVRRFQARQGLRPTGAVDRSTWTSLHARGHQPVLRKGARGEPVARLQRSLNAAVRARPLRVDGSFGDATSRAVVRYRKHLGLKGKSVVTPRVWTALKRGKVVPPRGR